jgi:uncharacterized protein YneF (UPF0154 family)
MINLIKKIIKFFDRLERKVRSKLSHWPVLYALLGSIGIVLIWRGIWIVADSFSMSGWLSILIGVLLSMFIGLFVSFFVGDRIIISGIKHEKRIDEKTEEEIKAEEIDISEIKNYINKEDIINKKTEEEMQKEAIELKEISAELKEIEKKLH